MICVFQIGALIMGIVMLIRGEVKLTRRGVRRGPGIRIAGVILMVPFPLAVGIGLCYTLYRTSQGKQPDPAMPGWMALVELALSVICVVLACIVAAAFSERCRPRRKRYDDDLDWDDEQPRRRRLREFDDDGYEEDSRSSRSRDMVDDDEDRPRHRRRADDELG